MRSVLFVFTAFLFVSCGNSLSPENQKRVEKIDSLNTVVLNIEKEMAEWNDSTLKDNAAEAKDLFIYLERNYPDKEDRSFWVTKMNMLKRIYRTFEKFGKNRAALKVEIPLAKKQLDGLKNSIEAEKLTEKKTEEYMLVETDAVKSMNLKYTAYANEAKAVTPIWDTLQVTLYEIKADLDTLK